HGSGPVGPAAPGRAGGCRDRRASHYSNSWIPPDGNGAVTSPLGAFDFGTPPSPLRKSDTSLAKSGTTSTRVAYSCCQIASPSASSGCLSATEIGRAHV